MGLASGLISWQRLWERTHREVALLAKGAKAR
jgi:hypothetical protein